MNIEASPSRQQKDTDELNGSSPPADSDSFTGHLLNLLSEYVLYSNRTRQGEEEFRDHVRESLSTFLQIFSAVYVIFTLISWPLDFVLYESQAVFNAVFWYKLIVILLGIWLIACLNYSEWFRERVLIVFPWFVAGFSVYLGIIFGQVDAESGRILFHASYLLPMVTVFLPFYFLRRVVFTILIPSVFVITYLAIHPTYFNHGTLGAQLLIVSAAITISVPVGHYIFHLNRKHFFETLREKEDRQVIKDTFSRFVHDSIMNELLENPDHLELGGEYKEITVLYADINNFTGFSEGRDGQEVADVLNQILEAMSDSVLEFDGVVDKFLGDGLIAEFGILGVEAPDHASRAVKSSLSMVEAVDKLDLEVDETITIRTGIHTGTAATGNMGTDKQFDFTAVGDTMNVGSRLEYANKIYETSTIMSRSTYENCDYDLVARELDKIRLPGKDEPIIIYELLGDTEAARIKYKSMVNNFEEGLELYRNREWEEALEKFKNVLKEYPHDDPSRVFIYRINQFMDSPPSSDWDGSFNLTSKTI